MALFQKSVLQKHLKTLEGNAKIEKAYSDFVAYFHNPTIQENIRKSKEEQFQAGFLRALFVKNLGYTLNPDPDFNLTTELKNVKNSKKADGAILLDGKAIAVVELKGMNTPDLSKVEAQAFGYKNNQPDAVYVITSNFQKLRFYIDNAIEFIEFNLFTLTKEQFYLLWLCLAKESIFKHLPKKVNTASVMEEENVTKKLYKDYSAFKNALFNDLVRQNPDIDQLLLFKKSQKLIDRFLFIFFAEDKGLLPPNSITQIVKTYDTLKQADFEKPLYEVFQQYFGYINSGRPAKGDKAEIFAFNGGLFAPDPMLDELIISDSILMNHTLVLSGYDFETEVDVNILGHIFEHSLNEIDEMTAQLEGQTIDKSKTKRKKDGVFYTPKYITKYIVDNTVGKLCQDKKTELELLEVDYSKNYINAKKRTNKDGKKTNLSVEGETILEHLRSYRAYLLELTICDPACGSGAFLNQALDFLIKEHQHIDELEAQLLNVPMVLSDITNDILERNIYGVDINEESVEIARLSLWLRSAKKGRALTTLSNNIKCGNSLIDDPEVAGDKAFHWETEFPSVFRLKEKQAFHVVLTTHNSRTSQRMIDYGIEKGEPIELGLEEEIELTKIFATLMLEYNYHCLAYNVCKDHVHLILVCEANEITDIVQKLKSISSKEFRRLDISMGHDPLEHKGFWSQKFYYAALDEWTLATTATRSGYLYNDAHLGNAIAYIQTNRQKHDLPESTELQNIIDTFITTQDLAFAPEYTGGFDVVIGNPPYLGGRDWKKEDGRDYEYLVSKYEVAEYQFDMYVIFWERGLKILKKDRLLGFITPVTWLNNQKTKKLRKYILNQTSILEILDFSNVNVFKDAVVLTMIGIIKNENNEKDNKVRIGVANSESIPMEFNYLQQKNWIDEELSIINTNLKEEDIIIKNKLESLGKPLEVFSLVKFGIKIYETGKGNPPQNKNAAKEKIFEATKQLESDYRPYLEGKDIDTYVIKYQDRWLKYGKNLAAPRTPDLFEGERLLVRRIVGKGLIAMYVNTDYVTSQLLQIVKPYDSKNSKYLLGILNSSLIGFYFRKKYNRVDKTFPEIRIYELRALPVVFGTDKEQEKLAANVDKIIGLKKNEFVLASKFTRLLQRKFTLEKLPKKLQSWHTLTFAEFVKELKKKKIKLGLAEEAEWEDYFETEKAKALAIQSTIDQTDKEIDQMVYALYGLTEEEIRIVEER